MTLKVNHSVVTGAAANPDVLVDGVAWDADHTVTGDLPVTQLNGGSGATSSTFWRGDGTWATAGGNPGGSTTQVQYNNGGSFAGITGATTDGTKMTLVAPILGTPTSGTLTNCTGLPVSTGISGTGTGVLTALAVNVGSAGSVVVNGGALGTPSSGTLTNATGLPISTGVSGLGTGVATFLATPSSANLRAALTDEAGTGSAYFVGGALGTPASGVGSNLTALNATQLTSGTIPAARTNGHQNGTATNDDAAAGEVGEYIENVLAAVSATSVTTVTPKTICQITLTAGDWDVSGMVNGLTATTTSVTGYGGSLSTTTNALDTSPGKFSQVLSGAFVPGNSATLGIPFPAMRFSVNTNTTVFLVAYMTFTASTMTAYGIIRARRVR